MIDLRLTAGHRTRTFEVTFVPCFYALLSVTGAPKILWHPSTGHGNCILLAMLGKSALSEGLLVRKRSLTVCSYCTQSVFKRNRLGQLSTKLFMLQTSLSDESCIMRYWSRHLARGRTGRDSERRRNVGADTSSFGARPDMTSVNRIACNSLPGARIHMLLRRKVRLLMLPQNCPMIGRFAAAGQGTLKSSAGVACIASSV